MLETEPVGLMRMKLIAMRDDERSALNRDVLRICRDEHSRQLLVWLVTYEEFSSQVWLTAIQTTVPTTARNELQNHDQ